MTPVPATRPQQRLATKIEETVAHCIEATQENERVVDTIQELLNARDTGRPPGRGQESRRQ